MIEQLNQKGLSAIITTMIYILISVAILALVVSSATDLISETTEQGNYKLMLTEFLQIKSAVEDSVIDKQTIELIIKNPGEITIDCTNNIITGNIDYTGDYREDITQIGNIATYKRDNKIYFEYYLDNYTRINLDCTNLDLNCSSNALLKQYNNSLAKGTNTLEVKYLDYNETSDEILISVLQKKSCDNQ